MTVVLPKDSGWFPAIPRSVQMRLNRLNWKDWGAPHG